MNCPCCGSSQMRQQRVLWPALTDAWRLAKHEIAYMERQQGLACVDCGANLRSMALAIALLRTFRHRGPFRDFVASEAAQRLAVLEINPAGGLTRFLAGLPKHVLARYPGVDMMQLPYGEGEFDLVLHSDTLEHVPQPVRGLSECRRVLKRGGICAFTVPIIVDRLTISREGLPPSYHGSPENPADNLVHTEYGADAWKQAVLAGFAEVRIIAAEYPAALALVAVK